MADRDRRGGRPRGLIPLPYRDLGEAFAAFAHQPGAVLLDSAAPLGVSGGSAVLLDSAAPLGARGSDPRGRCSLIGLAPSRVVQETAAGVSVDGVIVAGPLLEVLRRVLAEAAAERPHHLLRRSSSPVNGGGEEPPGPGLIGFIGYEAASRIAAASLSSPAQRGMGTAEGGGGGSPGGAIPGEQGASPEAWFGLYDTVAVFDHARAKAWTVGPDAPALAARLTAAIPPPAGAAVGRWTAGVADAEARARIAGLLALIAAGDLYQANLTWRWTAELPPGLAPFDLHRRLRARAPGPFGSFLNTGPMQLAGVSPERFLRLDAEGGVETRPIKGTRPRSSDAARDAALAAELVASAKDRAENLMIADLMRNDLSRVAVPGSVRVPSLCALESFPGAHHLVSTVQARLEPGRDAFDLLAATLPGGSITGAPKRRAMQVIAELEGAPRGPYCGAMIRIGLDGAMDSAILIRTLVVTGARVTAQAGGGIVADSDPVAEMEEARVKVRPLLAALAGPG